MKPLQGLAWLLGLQTLGELIARGLALPFPGPVIGLLLLVLALNNHRVQDSVGAVATFLLSHLSLLFVPVGVGVMTHLSVLTEHGLPLAVVIVVSTLIGLFVTAWVLQWLMRGPLSKAPELNVSDDKSERKSNSSSSSNGHGGSDGSGGSETDTGTPGQHTHHITATNGNPAS